MGLIKCSNCGKTIPPGKPPSMQASSETKITLLLFCSEECKKDFIKETAIDDYGEGC